MNIARFVKSGVIITAESVNDLKRAVRRIRQLGAYEPVIFSKSDSKNRIFLQQIRSL